MRIGIDSEGDLLILGDSTSMCEAAWVGETTKRLSIVTDWRDPIGTIEEGKIFLSEEESQEIIEAIREVLYDKMRSV